MATKAKRAGKGAGASEERGHADKIPKYELQRRLRVAQVEIEQLKRGPGPTLVANLRAEIKRLTVSEEQMRTALNAACRERDPALRTSHLETVRQLEILFKQQEEKVSALARDNERLLREQETNKAVMAGLSRSVDDKQKLIVTLNERIEDLNRWRRAGVHVAEALRELGTMPVPLTMFGNNGGSTR